MRSICRQILYILNSSTLLVLVIAIQMSVHVECLFQVMKWLTDNPQQNLTFTKIFKCVQGYVMNDIILIHLLIN